MNILVMYATKAVLGFLAPRLKFFLSHAGKGTAGVVAACVLIAFPPPFSWFVAAYLLRWSFDRFQAAFRLIDAENVPPVVTPQSRFLRTFNRSDHA